MLNEGQWPPWPPRSLKDRKPAISSVSVPILVVHADQDAAIGVRHGERLAATLPGSTFHRFEDCGHSVHIESPAHFNHTVLAFLSTVDPAVEP